MFGGVLPNWDDKRLTNKISNENKVSVTSRKKTSFFFFSVKRSDVPFRSDLVRKYRLLYKYSLLFYDSSCTCRDFITFHKNFETSLVSGQMVLHVLNIKIHQEPLQYQYATSTGPIHPFVDNSRSSHTWESFLFYVSCLTRVLC